MMNAPQWEQAVGRWSMLWRGRHAGRPCMCVTAPTGLDRRPPPPVSPEHRWLDGDYAVRAALAGFEATAYRGEAYPGYLLLAGWIANTYGATPRFDRHTIWLEPLQADRDGRTDATPPRPSFELDWSGPWLARVDTMHRAMVAAAGRDRFVVGQGCLLPGSDMLARVLGTQAALLAMIEQPDWAADAILKLSRNFVALIRRFHEVARAAGHEYWYGNSGWMPFWAPECYVTTQSDVSCMISPEMFERMVAPELELVGREFGSVWYHLDGQSALQHLPRLLAMPFIKVVQFTPMAGTPPNGPAHLDLYRRIQRSGKIVHISLPAENVEPLCRRLDPGRLCLVTTCRHAAEADELLRAAEGWTGR